MKMALADFAKTIEDLLTKIARARGISNPGPRVRYEPVRKSLWGRRSKRWFPPIASRHPSTKMPMDEFILVREGLAAALGSNGHPILDDRDLYCLEEAWVSYEKAWHQPNARASERIPKRFEILLRGDPDLSSVEGFASFLRTTVYAKMLAGKHSDASKDLRAINAALENSHHVFTRNNKSRNRLRSYFLVEAMFCANRMGDDVEHGFARRINDLVRDGYNDPLLEHALRAYAFFNGQRSPVFAQRLFEAHEIAKGQQWQGDVTPAIELVRAGAVAMSLGAALDDRPAFLGGWSAKSLIEQGAEAIEKLGLIADSITCRAAALRGLADTGQLDLLLDDARNLRGLSAKSSIESPHIDSMLAMVEARAFWKASGGTQKRDLWDAGLRVRETRRLVARHPGLFVSQVDLRLIPEIEKAATVAFGGTGHMEIT